MAREPMPEHVYNAVMERAGGACEAMIRGVCTGRAEHWHHRRLRSQGGRNEVVNGLAVCNACHGHFHRNVREAQSHGWIVRSVHDPAETPVVYRGQKKKLTEGGGVA